MLKSSDAPQTTAGGRHRPRKGVKKRHPISSGYVCTAERPSSPADEGPNPSMPRRQLLVIGTIPEKALEGDTQSHQATYVLLGTLRPRRHRPVLGQATSMWTQSPSVSYTLKVRGINRGLLLPLTVLSYLKEMRILAGSRYTTLTSSYARVEDRETEDWVRLGYVGRPHSCRARKSHS